MLRIAIVEDELEVQLQLESFIKKYAEEYKEKVEVFKFSDGDEIIEDYKADYDIILLDIQMKRMDGMTAAEKIRELDKETAIIFITNMAHYAIKGYAVDAMDFVLKPVQYFNFAGQLNKAVQRIKKRRKAYITVPASGGMVRLNLAEISYIESYGHRLIIHGEHREFTITDTMKNMEQKLANFNFFRCNNSYIVNLEHVEGIYQNTVTVSGHELQISRPKKKAFMDALADYIGGIK